ncbi:MAG: hypothetical protein ACXABD_00780 [Candidatus Thorarchaeota archaeon]
MTFEECELTILRSAVDKAEKISSRQRIENPEIKKIIDIVETFLKTRKLVCYGGTAINNILPVKDQFYDKELELPDYDFYSTTPVEDAKALSDIYYSKGFTDVEAKAGVHHGTYKVFVNFMPVADITYLSDPLYDAIKKDAIKVKGILYAPPNFLRMSMYLELSRPRGDVSRWEKVLKRLLLLNRNYPLKKKSCDNMDIQRKMDTKRIDAKTVFEIIRDTVVQSDGVFFGGYANALYSDFLPSNMQKKFKKIPDFDVLSEHPLKLSEEIQKKLQANGFNKVRIYKHEGIGEIIAPHYEVAIDKETVIFVYEPLACHSYNVIKENNEDVRIATIDTMLSFYLAFLYSDRTYYDKDRILCMAKYLFEVQQHNRLKQESILKRFSMNCYGQQQTINKLREEKAEKYRQLKNQRGTREYEEWFLKYNPGDIPTPKANVKLPKALKVLRSKQNATRKGKKRKIPKNKTKTKNKK